MRRLQSFGLLLALLVSLAFNFTPAMAATGGVDTTGHRRTYNVLVGAENPNDGIDINLFFPEHLRVHVGDTVLWKQRTFEIHTVTFLAGTPYAKSGDVPPFTVPVQGQASPVAINSMAALPAGPADGQYDGTTFANSGIMGLETGQVQTFSLTFTKTGSFVYVCLVHGMMMSGTIEVVPANVDIPSPEQVNQQAGSQAATQMAQAQSNLHNLIAKNPAPTKNADGTTTYHVLMGASVGEVDFNRFFPRSIKVSPGDTIEWTMGTGNMAPHTITFLNGAAEPPLVTPVNQAGGPPIFLINPAIVFPANAGKPLTSSGIFNSGLLAPGQGPQTYSLTIGQGVSGELPYICILHEASGMIGELVVSPK